ncbi:MAG: sugar ABC transporter permease [Firmicutes bacterium]|nr:sugar ABC transporter permease [Bacillota bacterium]
MTADEKHIENRLKPSRRKFTVKQKKFKETVKAFLILAPALVLIFIFYVIPIIQNILLSFTNYSVLHINNYEFVGLENYRYIFGEHITGLSELIIWTFIFAASVVIVSFCVATVLAVVLNNNNIKLRAIYRTIFIIPWVIPSVITLLMWRGLLNTNYGFVNKLLMAVGLGKIPWLTHPVMARVSVILITVWFSFPYLTVVALGMLQAIPRHLYESAQIDGSSALRSFISITLPHLLKGMVPILIMAFIMQFNQFGIYIVTKGEPAAKNLGDPGATDLLLTYVYNMAFRVFRYDLAAAYSVIIFIFVAIFALVNMKISERLLKE